VGEAPRVVSQWGRVLAPRPVWLVPSAGVLPLFPPLPQLEPAGQDGLQPLQREPSPAWTQRQMPTSLRTPVQGT
jgi:hypothetical protein